MASVSLISSTGTPEDPLDALAERLLDPKTASALNTLLDHAGLLAVLVSGLDGLITRGDTITESLASGAVELRAAQSAGTGELGQLLVALRQLTRPEVVDVVGAASRAVAAGSHQTAADRTRISGIRGMLRAIKDPDVSRTLGFAVSIAKAFGRELGKSETPTTIKTK